MEEGDDEVANHGNVVDIVILTGCDKGPAAGEDRAHDAEDEDEAGQGGLVQQDDIGEALQDGQTTENHAVKGEKGSAYNKEEARGSSSRHHDLEKVALRVPVTDGRTDGGEPLLKERKKNISAERLFLTAIDRTSGKPKLPFLTILI